jgi:hypothetical protein
MTQLATNRLFASNYAHELEARVYLILGWSNLPKPLDTRFLGLL